MKFPNSSIDHLKTLNLRSISRGFSGPGVTGAKGAKMDQEQNVSSQVYDGLAIVLRILEFLAVIVGIVLLVRIIYLFFGALSEAPGYGAIKSVTDPLISPLSGVTPVDTPSDGVFDIAATGVLLLVMVIEYIISGIRGWLQRKSEKALIQQIAHQARSNEMETLPEDEVIPHK
jgi:uncharacterized protein YggT (Ycf19 family)